MHKEDTQALLSFEDIMDREIYIISDSDTHNTSGVDWYADFVYPADYYHEMDIHSLSSSAHCVAGLRDWFSEPRVHAVPNVVAEIARFRDILHYKVTMLNEFETARHRSSGKNRVVNRRKRKMNGRFEERSGEAKSILEGICFDYVRIFKSAEKNAFRPESPDRFRCIGEKVLHVAESTGCKVDNKALFGQRYTDCEDLHADEQIVAAALYRSLYEGKETAIVTPDSDLARILVNTYYDMRQDSRESAEVVSFAMSKYPIRLYFVKKDPLTSTSSAILLIDSAEHLGDVDYLQEKGLVLVKALPRSVDKDKGFYMRSVSD